MGTDSRPTSDSSLHLRSLPLALALILSFSVIPVEMRPPDLGDLDWRISANDVFWNILFYVPLGIALLRRSLLVCVLSATALSASVESLQFLSAGRFPGLPDVAVNVTGALAGRMLARGLRLPDSLRAPRWDYVAIVAASLLGIVLLCFPGASTDLSNWDPEHDLWVGGEPGGCKTWKGAILELGIFSTSLDRTRMRDLAVRGPGSIRTYGREHPRQTVFELPARHGLGRINGVPLLGPGRRGEFFDALVRRESLTVAVWLRPSDLDRFCTIVSYSAGRRDRNMILAQQGRRFAFQIRTPSTGPDASTAPRMRTRRLPKLDRALLVAGTYDGRISRIYIDGERAARANLAADARVLPLLADLGLPGVATLIGALVSVGVLAVSSPGARAARWVLGPFAGFLGAGLSLLGGGAGSLPGFAPWYLVLGMTGGLVIAAAVER